MQQPSESEIKSTLERLKFELDLLDNGCSHGKALRQMEDSLKADYRLSIWALEKALKELR